MRSWAKQVALVILLLGLTGCGAGGVVKAPVGGSFARYTEAPRLHVSAAFGPDGKLWRLVPTKEHVYVDYSVDLGKTFSAPMAVNAQAQHIQTKDEDRPQITVARDGHVYVAYSAYSTLPWTSWLSMADGRGGAFSTPVNISDQSREARHYQTRLAVDPNGRLQVFWHDDREHASAGNALYQASAERPGELGHLSHRKIVGALCECCRTAVDFEPDGQPLLLARLIYPVGVRDHGLIGRFGESNWSTRRVSEDNWQIEACPEHGPALSVAASGRYHIAWFTQGSARKGLFYAYSSDQGRHFSKPLPLGDASRLPGHADVLAVGDRVTLTWREFDGVTTRVMSMQSQDGGDSFTSARMLAETAGEADFPFLLKNAGGDVYLSWSTQNEGYRLIPLN